MPMPDTSVRLLTWRVIYGGYVADGHVYDYLVTKDPTGWVALYHPAATSCSGPYSLLPFGRAKTRRAVQRSAEEFERKSR